MRTSWIVGAALVTCAAVCPVSSFAEPEATTSATLEFKGLVVGQAVTTQQIQSTLGISCGAGANQMQVCNGQGTILGYSGSFNVVVGPDGILDRIDIRLNQIHYADVADAFHKKFGPPTSIDHSTVQNKFGAKFENEHVVWGDLNGVALVLRKYAGGLDKSSVTFSTKRDRDLLSRGMKKSNDL
ncbi:hypothetical protein F0160_21080 [Paraburkholderia sp. JPY303]|uniref:hypothetical protein n=1 Tax=Paraburkholderia atlantica TaxID=2654982 RepID=UPI0015919C5C|nr:hypothetical protein [Paraburkholderia atlantica]NUY32983.1 hypothetical protein [Paraburkholderia atlantica]